MLITPKKYKKLVYPTEAQEHEQTGRTERETEEGNLFITHQEEQFSPHKHRNMNTGKTEKRRKGTCSSDTKKFSFPQRSMGTNSMKEKM